MLRLNRDTLAGASLLIARVVGLSVPAADPARGKTAAGTMRASHPRPDRIPFPEDNASTPEKVALGKLLYFDPRLSRDFGSDADVQPVHEAYATIVVGLGTATRQLRQEVDRFVAGLRAAA